MSFTYLDMGRMQNAIRYELERLRIDREQGEAE